MWQNLIEEKNMNTIFVLRVIIVTVVFILFIVGLFTDSGIISVMAFIGLIVGAIVSFYAGSPEQLETKPDVKEITMFDDHYYKNDTVTQTATLYLANTSGKTTYKYDNFEIHKTSESPTALIEYYATDTAAEVVGSRYDGKVKKDYIISSRRS